MMFSTRRDMGKSVVTFEIYDFLMDSTFIEIDLYDYLDEKKIYFTKEETQQLVEYLQKLLEENKE